MKDETPEIRYPFHQCQAVPSHHLPRSLLVVCALTWKQVVTT